MLAALKRGRTQDVAGPQKIPVYFLYYTAWLDGAGNVVYGADIYGRDARLLRALQNIDGVFVPSYNGNAASGKTY